ncbi:MAG: AAA family ATPase, partial [Promethearchaeota archaeon]
MTKTLLRFSKFPVIGIFGPRQSGKTTLAKHVFKKHVYLNFEDPIIRSYASENPKEFLHEYE